MSGTFTCPDFLDVIKHIPGLNSRYAVDVIGGSASLYEKMLLQFLHSLPSYINVLDCSLRLDEWSLFAVRVHGIKGSLRQIGSFHLADTAEALENAAKLNDTDYCHKHYIEFKTALLSFLNQLNAAIEPYSAYYASLAENKPDANINDYLDDLMRIKTALEDYDCLLAADILSPIFNLNYNCPYVQSLLLKTQEALDVFQPQLALDAIISVIHAVTDV